MRRPTSSSESSPVQDAQVAQTTTLETQSVASNDSHDHLLSNMENSNGNGHSHKQNGLKDSHHHHHSTSALPGRPKRKRVHRSKSSSGRASRSRHGFVHRFYKKWLRGCCPRIGKNADFVALFVAAVLWYSLGVISIGTSKLLLNRGVPPLYLTLQQFFIGSSLLRFLLNIRFLGSSGLAPWPTRGTTAESIDDIHRSSYLASSRQQQRSSSSRAAYLLSSLQLIQPSLIAAACFFCCGFLATNLGFSGSSAAFVETIKAAEPITSASVAVWWGIEQLSRQETTSLLVIVLGVLLSTVGNQNSKAEASKEDSTLKESLKACAVVMTANLCFSFRGLYQKLFRATPEGSNGVIDDLNLQFRMQQVGCLILLIPVLVWDSPRILQQVFSLASTEPGLLHSGILWRYAGLALLNGCAFASYNLASTYILSRISVVHHAALNCIRRIFAICVTSIAFQVPITLIGALGIALSFCGFMSFTKYKSQRAQRQPKPVSSLLPVSAVK